MQNRATLSRPEQYGWVHFLAGCYVVAVGSFSVAVWCQDGEYLRAVMCAGAQILAIVCAVLARRAFTGEMPGMGWLMVGFTLGCAYWSALGIFHAWGPEAEPLMVGFLAALEPLLFLAAEHIKEGRDALREQARRDQADLEAELARNRENRWGGVGRLAAASGLSTGFVPLSAAAQPVDFGQHSQIAPERPAVVTTNTGYATVREHAIALKKANPMLSEVKAANQLGIPRATIGSWWRGERLTRSTAAA